MRTTAKASTTRTPRTKAVPKKSGKAKPQVAGKGKRKRNGNGDVSESEGDEYKEDSESESDVQEKQYDSDALDEESDPDNKRKRRVTKSKSRSPKKNGSPSKKRRKIDSDGDAGDEFDGEVVGEIVKAPTTGQVPPGQISQNTLDFLNKLKDPKYNDREWFKLHEPVYRLAEQEWKDFIEKFIDVLTSVDPQIPPLPPKDVIHRIYRDIRFSNDKTPYKTGFSASISRSGRKGIFAGYHILVSPGGKSALAAGSWCPSKNELATIRSNIQRNSTRLRRVISSPEFVNLFGEAKPRKDGGRQNVFGMDDELKVAPKGIDKGHKDIHLLKCRSFAVFLHFEDKEVLAPDFTQKLGDILEVMRPLVHCLNDMMTVNGGGGEGNEDEDDDEAEGE